MGGEERLRRAAEWTAPGVRWTAHQARAPRSATRSERASRARAGCRACRCGSPTSGDGGLVAPRGPRRRHPFDGRAAAARGGRPGRHRRARLAHAARTRTRPRAPARGMAPSHPVPAAPRGRGAAPPEQAEDLKALSKVAHELSGETDLYAAPMTLSARSARSRPGLVGRSCGTRASGRGARGHRPRPAPRLRGMSLVLAGRARRRGFQSRRAGLPARRRRHRAFRLARADRRRVRAPGSP